MKAQLATSAVGSPVRSPSRAQRQASTGRAPGILPSHPARAGRDEHAVIHAAIARGIATPWPALPHAGALQRSFGHHDMSATQAHTGDAAATAAPAPSSPVHHPAQGANTPMQAAPADIARQDGAAEGDASSAPGVPALAFGQAVAFTGVPGTRPSTQVLASRAIAQPKLAIDGLRGAAAATAIAPTGGGSPLPDPTRARMEGLFGLHLDGVRVVESGQPEQLGARAFTIGHEIHAARGEDLAASRSAELLGHELAHVVQQRQGRARPDAAQDHGGALVVDAALEAEADAVGARIGRGEPAGIGGAAAACPAPVAQGYRIELDEEQEQFDNVDQLIGMFEEDGLVPDSGWNADHRALLFQWMREDHTFTSRAELIHALGNTPALRPAAPADVDQLVERYEGVFEICKNADQVLDFVGERRAITQVPQERGDMFDVASALALDHEVCVVVIPTGRADDCDKILDFYRSFPMERVCLVADDRFDRRQLGGQQFLSVSRSTQIMYEHSDDRGFRTTLADTMTGPMNAKDEAAFEEELVRRDFRRGTRYALVMYRDSGHRPGNERAPSHPELDTGTRGFEDLAALTGGALKGSAKLKPVPMGTQVPDGFDVDRRPNLINYWSWDCFRAYPEGTIRRQKENALLRYLREEYKVVAIGMRSGGMDALAYVGIPIISIDVAAEFMSKDDRWNHYIEDGSAASWRRAAKKEKMLGDQYHNVYLGKLRHDPNVGALYEGDPPETSVDFEGAFGDEDQQRMRDAVARYFGPTNASARGARDLDPTSPLSSHNIGLLIKHRMLERKEDSNFFKRYAEEPALLNALLNNSALLKKLLENPKLLNDPAQLKRLLEAPPERDDARDRYNRPRGSAAAATRGGSRTARW